MTTPTAVPEPAVVFVRASHPEVRRGASGSGHELSVLLSSSRQHVVVRVPLEDVRAALALHDEAAAGSRASLLLDVVAEVGTDRRAAPRTEMCRCPSHTATRNMVAARQAAPCVVCALMSGKLPLTEREQLLAAFIGSLDEVDRALLHRSCSWRGRPVSRSKLPSR